MLIKPGLAVSQMSGTMGGVVASHNRFGQYFRRWTKPTDPKSPAQMARRAGMGGAIIAWNALDAAGKESWDTYGANTPWVNRFGETVYLSGMQHFVRVYTFSRMITDELGDVPDTLGPCGSAGGLPDNITGAVATIGVAAGLSLAYDDTAAWCSVVGAVAVVRMSRPRSNGQVYGDGPYRYCGVIVGAAVPPVSPLVVDTADLPWAIIKDERVDFRIRIGYPGHTLSNELKISAVVGA